MDAPTGIAQEYTGESGRTFGDRLKDDIRAPFPIHQHCQTMGPPVNLECFIIVDRESQDVTRTIKEAMYIQVNDPSLNRKLGKYQLPYIWDDVLHAIPLQVLICICWLPVYTSGQGSVRLWVYDCIQKPSGLVFSTVNWITWAMVLMSCRKFSLYSVHCVTKVSSTYLFHNLSRFSLVLMTISLKCPIYKVATMG